ncbi:peptidoglycan endopeptidase LytE [Psychrobacillus sp. OK028]|uniref:C40 family peptidase n=1 Tax=Psychrobacillus sp. OK028 TaxID=1884359 RepID=UPI00087E274A|nr:C40 family peptidase [Psychrobacillus sp. OK028]SDM43518.1 peptidoglycan endopeptidase LytE [Psychrobacillus sp. OK028]
MFKKVLIVTVLLTSFASTASANKFHEVKKGDTLTKIAKSNKVTLNDLRSWNKLTKDSIYIKQKLIVTKPTAMTKAPAKVIASKSIGIGKKTLNQKPVDVPVKVKEESQPTTPPLVEQARNLSIKGQAVYPSLIDFAKRLEGIPYLYAGNTIAGFDCSGFIYFVHNQAGLNMPRQSSEGYFAQSANVSSPLVGDLVFFENTYKEGISHMGIYIGNNEFIHAGSKGVEVASLNSVYWKEHFVSFKRFHIVSSEK